MALRNLARRKLRTLLTVGMVAVGTSLIVFMIGLSEGSYGDMIEIATRSWAGHFQVMAEGYDKKPTLFKAIRGADALAARLAADFGVEAVTVRVETAGLVSMGSRTSGTMLVGVDPATEARVASMGRAVKRGRWLDSAWDAPFEMVLGSGLAKKLGAEVGSEVSFVAQAADGSIAAELFTVVGLLDSGTAEIDASAALVRLDRCREMLALGDRAHRIVGRFGNIERADLPGGGFDLPAEVEYLGWRQVLPALDNSIKTDRAGVRILLSILLGVVILGVANTMLMVVMERTREFGVMASLGVMPGDIVALVVFEAAWLTAFGAALGIVAGGLANEWFSVHGISVVADAVEIGGVLFKEMHTKNSFLALAGAPAIVVFCGVVAAFLPAVRAARMKPAAALRKG